MFWWLLLFFFIPTPSQICGTSKHGDIRTNVLSLSSTTFVKFYLSPVGFDFFWKINKSMVYLLLKENYCFTFHMVLQSLFTTCVTLNSLGRAVRRMSFNSRVLLQQMMQCVFVWVGLCLSVDYKVGKQERIWRETARSLSCDGDKRQRKELSAFSLPADFTKYLSFTPFHTLPSAIPHFTSQRLPLTPRHPGPQAKTNELTLLSLTYFPQV